MQTLLTNSIAVAFPSQGGDVISTILRREVTYDQKQGTCAEVRGNIMQLHKHLYVYVLMIEHLFRFTSAF